MKISKKILTFLAPIATVAVVTPVMVACNKETFSFQYGDSINCYKKTEKLPKTAVHSLNIVKSTAPGKVNVVTEDKVDSTYLANYVQSKTNVYFDLVASLAVYKNTGFALSWTETSGKFTIYVETKDGKQEATDLTLGTEITYAKTTEEGKTDIMLNIKKGTDIDISVKSYAFKGVKLQ